MGRKESGAFEKMINDGRTAFLSVPYVAVMLTGGVPIVIDGQVIGSVGVSGVKPKPVSMPSPPPHERAQSRRHPPLILGVGDVRLRQLRLHHCHSDGRVQHLFRGGGSAGNADWATFAWNSALSVSYLAVMLTMPWAGRTRRCPRRQAAAAV